MRQQILDYINTLSLGSFSLSQELPWSSSGTPLYLSNIKKIYVDRSQFTNDPLLSTLDGLVLNSEITSVKVYFASDAKLLPANYDTLVSNIKLAKDVSTIEGVNRRECDVLTTFENDTLVTEFEFRFTKLI
jgi:hypothetical protein